MRGREVHVPDHMPSSHRRFIGWTHERVIREATAVGANAATMVEVIMRERKHPEQGFRTCVGILRLAKQYGTDRLEAACERGLEIGARSYGSIQSILKSGLDRQSRLALAADSDTTSPAHANVRGPGYYH